MNENGYTPLPRRQWLQRLPMPVIAASLGAPLLDAQSPSAQNDLGARAYNIRNYDAKGDGVTLDTSSVQAAVDACHRDGGGTVLVPAGTFHIGALELRSNVTLHIAAGGKLLGSADGKQYHAVDAIPLTGDSTLEDGNWALIFAVDSVNVTVEGPGTIDGQGIQFHSPSHGVPPPADSAVIAGLILSSSIAARVSPFAISICSAAPTIASASSNRPAFTWIPSTSRTASMAIMTGSTSLAASTSPSAIATSSRRTMPAPSSAVANL